MFQAIHRFFELALAWFVKTRFIQKPAGRDESRVGIPPFDRRKQVAVERRLSFRNRSVAG